MELTRRNLVTGSALAAGVAAAGIAMNAATARADETAAAAPAGDWDQEADLVIVGAGMGGLCAGVQALQDGIQNVTIVEISRWLGGGTSFSVGTIHVGSAGTTVEEYDAFTEGEATSDLSHNIFLQVPDLMEWLSTLDLPIEVTGIGETTEGSGLESEIAAGRNAPTAHMVTEDGTGGVTSCHYFFDHFGQLFQDLGGTLLTQTGAKQILMDNRGYVEGLLCRDANGNDIRIHTSQVVLACGGFQNDSELKQRYLGIDGMQAANMGSPYNTGAGIKMATAVGASLQGDMSHVAGLFVAAQPAKNWMEDIKNWEANDYNGDQGGKWWLFDTIVDRIPGEAILVNSQGKRFVDETLGGHSGEADMIRQKRASYVMVCDDTAWNNWMQSVTFSLMSPMQAKIDLITSDAVGGSVYQADTIEELADALNASGYATHQVHKANLVQTINDYNAAAEAGTCADLEVPRGGEEVAPIATPPFHAMPLRNAIFVTFGGVAVNEACQVLDVSHQPIPGLYAASPCAGGFMHEFYVGSIAHAGVTGRIAANSAAAALGVAAPAADAEATEEAAE